MYSGRIIATSADTPTPSRYWPIYTKICWTYMLLRRQLPHRNNRK